MICSEKVFARCQYSLLLIAGLGVFAVLLEAFFGDPSESAESKMPGAILVSRIETVSNVAPKKVAGNPRIEPLVAIPVPVVQKVKTKDDEMPLEDLQSEVVRELLSELASAVRKGDRHCVLSVVSRLRTLLKGEPSHGSVSIRNAKMQILGALGVLGYDGVDQVIDYLGDSDILVAQQAEQVVFETLKNRELGDIQRADIVTAAAEEMTSSYALTRLFNQFMRMRHSVGADALAQIASSGTPAAKAALERTIGAFTGNMNITTTEQLEAWLVENPDSPDDDLAYGPKTKNVETK